ncbi:hypothetical protein BGZ76_011756 [Entomortierella beljakovae]|nr:hypothetical protein BGZ76_011756 [Entomortierella beljakovae]
MAVPPQSSLQYQHIPLPSDPNQYSDPSSSAASELPIHNTGSGSKKQKTTPPCDRCRQRRIKCDRLEPTCSSCVKYKATCVRTVFPAGLPLSTVSVEATGGLRVLTSGKRDRHLSETEILDSCLRDVRSLQLSRIRRIEQFFDRLDIDETRLDEIGWIADQIKSYQESNPGSANNYHPEEIIEKLGPRTPSTWVRQLMPLLMSTKQQSQITRHGTNVALQGTLTESGNFICPAPKPTQFPTRVPLSVLNKTMFELSVYDCTEYLGPIAGTRATSWNEEMRFSIPWLVPEPKVQESLLVLPPVDQILDLIEWMIQSPLYTYFPILTKASILNALSAAIPGPDAPSLEIEKPQSRVNTTDSTGALPQRITGRVSAIFLLNAIMALGAAYRSNAIKNNVSHRLLKDPKSREKNLDFQVFFDRSRALTVYILEQPRVSSLQGLLLLMKCPAIPGIQNLYREQTCAMALSLGLHRDPEPWTLCRSVIQLRRNIFWCCYVIDASYSLSSGSPERFPDDYITIGLPVLPSIELGDDAGEIDAENETQRIGFLIEQAKLWKIVKKIRRCGQTSNKSPESYMEGANLFRNMDTPISATSNGSSSYGYTDHYTAGYLQNGEPKTPTSPPWVWRADSARRILDVELAQWQMDLPQHLKFDFALTRSDDPCPFAIRVNGLGAMLQVIFNEVLILLHHPFLVVADPQSQSKQEQAPQAPNRSAKSRSSTNSAKGSRSRSSSSSSRPSFSSGLSNNADESSVKVSRALPPFLNTCTKAAEAITFLIDHLLNTTPEWLVCHNEVDSALHIAERVHALNVSMSNTSLSDTSLNSSGYSTYFSSHQAKCQLKKTRSYRKTIKELDQFTMSSGYRPELLTKEYIARGSPRERQMRSMRLMLTKRKNSEYYRLPRNPPEDDTYFNGSQHESDDRIENGTGQDHLEMRLSFIDQRVWIRYYNIRIKDGVESRNGSESWIEILNPYVQQTNFEIIEEEEDEELQSAFNPLGGANVSGDMSMSPTNGSKQKMGKRRGGSKDEKKTLPVEPMDPPNTSAQALIDFFSKSGSSGFEPFTGTAEGSSYYSNSQLEHSRYGHSIYYPGQVSLDGYDRSRMSVDDHSHDHTHPVDLFQPGHEVRGFHIDADGSTIQQDQRHHPFSPNGSYPPSSYDQQQAPQIGPYGFEIHPSVVGFDPSNSASSYSSPESQSIPNSSDALGLNLMTSSSPLPLQNPIAFDGNPYLNLLQQHIPHSQILEQSNGSSHIHSYQQQQSLDPSLNNLHQTVRPFYGMPMGGFMAPSVDNLPVINRTMPAHRTPNAQRSNFLPSTPPHQAQQSGTWSLDGHTTQGTSFASKSDSDSPPLAPSISTSIPASPLPSSPLGRIILSPTSESMQSISNRLNSWEGISGSKQDSQLDYSGANSSTTFQSSADQQTNSVPHFPGAWSSAPSTSEILASSHNTPRSSVLSEASGANVFVPELSNGPVISSSTMMDGIEAGSSSSTSASILNGSNSIQRRHLISAVPEASFGDYTTTTTNPDDSTRFYRPRKENDLELETSDGVSERDSGLSLQGGQGMSTLPGGAGRRL